MTWSLGEVEALARKAARGGGLTWGMADEAAKAVLWLVSFGLPGPDALAGYLQDFDEVDRSSSLPTDPLSDTWRAASGQLCPIATGTVLSDLQRSDVSLTLHSLSWPLLFLPFAAWSTNTARLEWQGVTFQWFDASLCVSAENQALLSNHARLASLSPNTQDTGKHFKRAWRADLSEATLQDLTHFAARTYAPETDASKLSGAGAGLKDED